MNDFEKVGRYQVIERIGVGSFIVAYRGMDGISQRPVAIKICIAQEENLRTGFLRLAETASSLRHPNIVSVLEFGSGEGKPYLIEEFVPGEHLGWRIQADEAIPWGLRLDYLTQIAHGLRYAHGQGVLHRHVSPRCIRVLGTGQVKITDFGIAQLAAATARLTDPRGHSETEGYLAPEQALGLRSDVRTDVFFFGALGYELLTYESPFAGNNLTDFLRRVLDTSDDATVARLRRLPEGVARILRRCLQRDPAERYAEFGQLLEDLEPLLQQERQRDGSAAPPSLDDTQAIPSAVLESMAQPKESAKDPLELATEYMARRREEAVRPTPSGPATLEETLPGAPLPQAGAQEPDISQDETVVRLQPAERDMSQDETVVRSGPAATEALAGTGAGGDATVGAASRLEATRGEATRNDATQAAAARGGRGWVAAAVGGGVLLLLLLLASFALVSRPEDADAKPGVSAPPLQQQTAEAAAPPVLGELNVDAVPWAELVRLEDASGHRLPLPPQAFTPLRLELPPGSYVVELVHPEGEEPWRCRVQVRAEDVAVCRGEFELVEVVEYFKQTGWWR